MPAQQASANPVTGKVVSFVAKKAAKEAVKDMATQYVGNLALDLADDAIKKGYEKKQGFKLVCLDGGKSSCDKPMQLKDVDLSSESNKKALDNKVSYKLEEMITSGKKLNKWMKFVDFLTGFTTVLLIGQIINAAVNSDIMDLFQEIAYESLISLGWLVPAVPTSTVPQVDSPSLPNEDIDVDSVPDGGEYSMPIPDISKSYTYKFHGKGQDQIFMNLDISKLGLSNMGSVIVFERASHVNTTYFPATRFNIIGSVGGVMTLGPNGFIGNSYQSSTLTKNGKDLGSYGASTFSWLNDSKKVMVQLWNATQSGYYMKIIWQHFNGDIISWTGKSDRMNNVQNLKTIQIGNYFSGVLASDYDMKVSVYSKSTLVEYKAFNPVYTDLPMINEGKLTKPKEMTVKLPPISSYPVYDTNGKQLKWVQVGDGLELQTPDGKPVPESDIDSVGDALTELPDGTIVFQPDADPTKQPDKLADPDGTDGGKDGDDKIDKGNPDDVNWKKLKMIPAAFTKAFPFSIPWDVKNAIDATFGNIKEVKDITFDFEIKGISLPIHVPDYFMPWFAWLRRFMLVFFDISLIYAIRQWFGGAS